MSSNESMNFDFVTKEIEKIKNQIEQVVGQFNQIINQIQNLENQRETLKGTALQLNGKLEAFKDMEKKLLVPQKTSGEDLKVSQEKSHLSKIENMLKNKSKEENKESSDLEKK